MAERKLATVLFADLVGSTQLAASEDPERTRAKLDRFYDAMAEEIVRAGGTVEKFVGDAVMAAFGAPVAQEDHVERALHAALAMQRRLTDLFDDTMSLRIGVNSGDVVVGRAREGSSFVSGDAVNVAARLEQAAEPDQILVGERTVAAAVGAFEFGPPARAEAKGKAEGVACRRLLRALSLRPRGAPGLPSAFVGRDRELELLRGAFERAVARGQPQLVTITGEAGVGKTRLVREIWDWLGHDSREPLRRTGRCPPYGHAVTYAPIGEAMKEHFGILDSDPPARILDLLAGREMLGLALGLDVAGDLHPIVAHDGLHDAWVELVDELAAERPLVLLVEDLHWAESSLLELLERVVLEVRGAVLLIATARPELLERSPSWGRGRVPSEWIWLEPLEPDAAERLVEELAAGEVPDAVRRVLRRAEGNPFFLEELLGTLIERGVLHRTNGWDVATMPPDAGIPDSVQALLAARVDLLPAEEKAALQAAAVVGRTFWPGALREVLGGAEPDFRLLEQRDLVRRRSGSSLAGEREFVFKHALTREVAYNSLTARDRARLHAGVAAWIERRGDGRDEDAALLARHYAEAVRPEDADLAWADEPQRHAGLRAKAVGWLRRAASLAAGRYEVEEALVLLDRALPLANDDQERIGVLREIGQAHTLRYDPQSFRRSMEQALALEPARAGAAEIYAELAYYALGRPYMWREPPPRELGEEWLNHALELAAPGTAARGYALLAQALSAPSETADAMTEVLAVGEALGDPRLVVYACEARTLAATEAGRFEEACDWVDRALAVPQPGDPGHQFHQYWNAGFVYARAGRLAEARRFVAACDELAASLTAHDEVHAVGLLAVLESVLGNWEALARLAERVEAASAANDDFPCQFNWRSLLVCGLGLAHVGERDEARRLEDLGRATAVVAGPPEREPALLRLALLRGDLGTARAALGSLPPTGNPFTVDSAAARLDALWALDETARVETEAEPFLERESYTRPFALRALGVVRRDKRLLRDALAGFEVMGAAWHAEQTRKLLA